MTTIPGRLENVIRMYNKGSLEIRQMLLQWWCRPIFPTILDSILDSIFPPPQGSIFPILGSSSRIQMFQSSINLEFRFKRGRIYDSILKTKS